MVVPKHPIFLIQTSVQEETERNNPAENKATYEQGIEGNHEKEKTVQRKIVLKILEVQQKNRPND